MEEYKNLNGCEVQIENSVTRDNCSAYSTIEDRFQLMEEYKNHGCEVWIEKSIRWSLLHHEAVPSDAKQWSWGTYFSINTKQPW